MTAKRTKEILELLDQQYTREYKCYLNYETPWQLLVATMLSAQCTDARVNIVTKDLPTRRNWNRTSDRRDFIETRQKILLRA